MDERLAQTLIAGGIVSLEELGYVPIGELLRIEGLDESDAQLYRKRAREYMLRDATGNRDDGDTVDA